VNVKHVKLYQGQTKHVRQARAAIESRALVPLFTIWSTPNSPWTSGLIGIIGGTNAIIVFWQGIHPWY